MTRINKKDLTTMIDLAKERLWALIDKERERKEDARVNTIKTYYAGFKSMLAGDPLADTIVLSIPIVKVVVKCYFDSIYRYKIYSNTSFADKHKQAAYLLKWIARMHPIQIRLARNVTPSIGLSWVNSCFAVHCALSSLFQETDAGEMMRHCPDALYTDLLYQAQYRNVSGRSMAALMYAVEKICFQAKQLEELNGNIDERIGDLKSSLTETMQELIAKSAEVVAVCKGDALDELITREIGENISGNGEPSKE